MKLFENFIKSIYEPKKPYQKAVVDNRPRDRYGNLLPDPEELRKDKYKFIRPLPDRNKDGLYDNNPNASQEVVEVYSVSLECLRWDLGQLGAFVYKDYGDDDNHHFSVLYNGTPYDIDWERYSGEDGFFTISCSKQAKSNELFFDFAALPLRYYHFSYYPNDKYPYNYGSIGYYSIDKEVERGIKDEVFHYPPQLSLKSIRNYYCRAYEDSDEQLKVSLKFFNSLTINSQESPRL